MSVAQGKYMEVIYDHRFDAQGGHIKTYLLEKARVVHHGEGERNFHCFYQVCKHTKWRYIGKHNTVSSSSIRTPLN